jgi:alkanesulfonate monooxygenase SsuD/methylene tetrahydromethanopterin reductase-like flavin-dependent oxidoreductase (luciferase family)
MVQRQMHLGVYAVGTGNHIAGWRHPGATSSGEDFEVFKTITASAERGKLDFVFVGDSLAFLVEGHPGQMVRFEPTTLLSARLRASHRALAWSGRRRPAIPSPTTSPGNSVRSIISAAAVPAGMSSPRR